ncbi:SURF1 family protein [Candidatus Pseudothioglobus sp. Uisw_086]|jgi:surfeit locus 1 family protein|uniref:SURF1 family protein n=1 Tax=Candidatus Pseudothioglobus sp. Uisw_086 TaxID=3230998 RepID=UPI00233B6278|nr:SURF1 family protein [Candidatus Thioglobus sp.]MDC1318035.1 SURF1 family protein [Candidatus Thioglobus sp.]MDC3360597.1 SURF1 family protein [Candidatus Thioglobus sp.]|tara:strand:+ start:799 stop:1497 length:699 start_codon:yes stop_codon:yes gene_type:complete
MSLRFILPSILITATFAFLVSLGFWQLERADDKRSIEASIKQANTGSVELIKKEEGLQSKEYYEVRLQGKYLSDKQFIYDNQIVDQVSGYYVLTPYALEGQSKAILINRGFIPWNGRRDKLADIVIGQETREIKVQISKPIKRMELKPSEVGIQFPALIQSIDLQDMADRAKVDFSSVIGLLDASASNGFIRKWEPYTGSIEKHIGYAVQWFLMALVLAIIGIRIAIKQRKK